MLFIPTETDGFSLVHTAKQYLEVVPNPNRVRLDNLLPLWDGELMDVDVDDFERVVDDRVREKLR